MRLFLFCSLNQRQSTEIFTINPDLQNCFADTQISKQFV